MVSFRPTGESFPYRKYLYRPFSSLIKASSFILLLSLHNFQWALVGLGVSLLSSVFLLVLGWPISLQKMHNMNKNSSHLLPYYYLTCWVYLFSFLTEKYCWRYVSHLRAVNCNMNNNCLVHAASMLLLHLHMTDLPFLLCAGGSDMCIIFCLF